MIRSIFPEYANTSGPYVSQRRINKAKPFVIAILKKHETDIYRAFAALGKRRKREPHNIHLDIGKAIEKVENAQVSPESDWAHGESDECTIWVAKNKLNDSMLIGTLLHESLHYCTTIDGKDICTKDEHLVMKWLGEDI